MEMAVVSAQTPASPLRTSVSVTVTGCLLDLEVEDGRVEGGVGLVVEQVVQLEAVLHPAEESFLGAAGGELGQPGVGGTHGEPQQGDRVDDDADSQVPQRRGVQ